MKEPSEGLEGQKRAMRAAAIARRDAVDPAARARRSERLCAWLLERADRAAAAQGADGGRPFTAAAFRSMGSEPDTRAFCAGALERGWRLCLPAVVRTGPAKQDRSMVFVQVNPTDFLADKLPAVLESPTRAFAPEELGGLVTVAPEELDFVAVPLVAFDDAGGRLGYGGGHYDRLLPRLRPDAVALGAALEEQRVAAVPRGPWDVPLAEVLAV